MAEQNFYFTADGNYGGDELIVIDISKLDDHFLESVDNLTGDSNRLDFAKWFKDNNHEFNGTDGTCETCESEIY